jgi:hypothetical protein
MKRSKSSPEHGANFDLIVGEWGDGTSAGIAAP